MLAPPGLIRFSLLLPLLLLLLLLLMPTSCRWDALNFRRYQGGWVCERAQKQGHG